MNSAHIILEQAISLYECKAYEQAIETAGKVAGDKEHAFTYNEITAQCYFELNQFDNAIWFYEKALALKPDNIEVESRLAAAYDLAKQPEKAFVILKRHYTTYPNNAFYVYQFGYHLLGNQKHTEALGYLLKAYELNPDIHPDINFYIGVCYHNLHQWNEALTFLKAQTIVKDGMADCYIITGNCYFHMYENEKAIAAYSQAIWFNENHDEAYWQRFLLKKEAGDYAGAEADIRKALAINPNRVQLTSEDGKPLSIKEVNVDRLNGNVNFVVDQ